MPFSPRAALQLACDAPAKTIMARHANQLAAKPKAKLLTKEDDWPACLMTLEAHMDRVTSVAVTPDGATAVSGSWDSTVRCGTQRWAVRYVHHQGMH